MKRTKKSGRAGMLSAGLVAVVGPALVSLATTYQTSEASPLLEARPINSTAQDLVDAVNNNEETYSRNYNVHPTHVYDRKVCIKDKEEEVLYDVLFRDEGIDSKFSNVPLDNTLRQYYKAWMESDRSETVKHFGEGVLNYEGGDMLRVYIFDLTNPNAEESELRPKDITGSIQYSSNRADEVLNLSTENMDESEAIALMEELTDILNGKEYSPKFEVRSARWCYGFL